jgi:hypothetical protein
MFGITGINFLIHWVGSSMHFFVVQHYGIGDEYIPYSETSIIKFLSASDRKLDSDPVFRGNRGLWGFFTLLSILLFFGSFMSVYEHLSQFISSPSVLINSARSYGGRFYQAPLSQTIPQSVPVSCVLGEVLTFAMFSADFVAECVHRSILFKLW